MKKAATILYAILILCFYSMVSAQNGDKTLLIDATEAVAAKTAGPVGAIADILEREALREAVKASETALKLKPNCADGAQIQDTAEFHRVEMFEGLKGQFIRHIAVDYRIYLYAMCGYQGLAAVRGSRVLANYAYPAEGDIKLQILDDIDQNGRDELLIQTENSDRRSDFRSMRIVEFSPNGLERRGRTEIFSRIDQKQLTPIRTNGSGPVKRVFIPPLVTASKIFVKHAANRPPVFFRQEFKQTGDDWTKNSELEEFKLAADSTVYIDIVSSNFPKGAGDK